MKIVVVVLTDGRINEVLKYDRELLQFRAQKVRVVVLTRWSYGGVPPYFQGHLLFTCPRGLSFFSSLIRSSGAISRNALELRYIVGIVLSQ